MKRQKLVLFICLFLFTISLIGFTFIENKTDNKIISYIVDSKTSNIEMFWKDDKGEIINTIKNLKKFVESKNSELIFAMNGGMYNNDFSPQGLFIQNKKTISPIDTTSGKGNFYLKPNGIFFISTENIAGICTTNDFQESDKIKFATQSGPMLVIDGKIHEVFKKGSKNLNIRNGVGILPNKKIVFAMSKQEINFYDFAMYFKLLGCKNALYLDGFVSRTYLPEKKWIQTDGSFGVIIGVTKQKQTN